MCAVVYAGSVIEYVTYCMSHERDRLKPAKVCIPPTRPPPQPWPVLHCCWCLSGVSRSCLLCCRRSLSLCCQRHGCCWCEAGLSSHPQ
jgi:hypothetical protein